MSVFFERMNFLWQWAILVLWNILMWATASAMDLNLICMLHLYCIAIIHLKKCFWAWLSFEHGFHNKVGSQITETLQCWIFMAYIWKGKWLKALVSLLFRVLTALARGVGFMIHLLFPVQHLVGALCSMSHFISWALHDVNWEKQ